MLTALALLAVLALAPPAYGAPRVNSFEGECNGVPGTARFPEGKLRGATATLRMVANTSGGSCSGVLNGRRVEGVPIQVHIDVRGPMSCSGPSQGDGRGYFVVGGRTITGAAYYRRVGVNGFVYLEGDTSGYASMLPRAFAGASDAGPIIQACNVEGVNQMRVVIETFSAAQPISSPEPDSGPRKPKRVGSGGSTYRVEAGR